MKLKNMHADDKILIRELTAFLNCQLKSYQELRDLVRKMLSRIILSRGDITGVVTSLEKKRLLLDELQNERQNHSALLAQWQERKSAFNDETSIATINSVLDKTEVTIREFLDEEEQLKKYIENILNKECSNTVQ